MNPLCAYTGLPYDFNHRNCWHHVRNVRRDAGIDTPEFDCATPAEICDTFEHSREETKGMIQVQDPREFDAVLMATKRNGRLVWHSGVYHSGMVSHCDRFAKQVRFQPIDEIRADYERVEFWR